MSNSGFEQNFNTGVSFMAFHTALNLVCTAWNLFSVLCKDGLMMVWWPERVASKLNNEIFLCLTENKSIYCYLSVTKFAQYFLVENCEY